MITFCEIKIPKPQRAALAKAKAFEMVQRTTPEGSAKLLTATEHRRFFRFFFEVIPKAGLDWYMSPVPPA